MQTPPNIRQDTCPSLNILNGKITWPVILIISIIVVILSVFCLSHGYTIIFQNLFYIPIIIACVKYLKKGFIFSCILSLLYFLLIYIFSKDMELLFQALIRVIIFIGISAIITYLALILDNQKSSLIRLSNFNESIISNAKVWLMVLGSKGNVIIWNKAAEEMSGYSSNEVIGEKKFLSLIYPDSVERNKIIKTITGTINNKGNIEEFITTILTKNGKNKIISWNITGIKNIDGKINEYIAIGLDITERKEAELALRESENRYRTLFENMHEGFAYCRMFHDELGKPFDWIFLHTNKAFETHTGLQNVQGKRVQEIIPDIFNRTPELFDIYEKVINTGESLRFELFFTPLNIWLHLSVYRPNEGYFAMIFENITERKQGEENLKNTIWQLETILENVPALVCFKDLDNRYVKVNPAVAKLMGKNVSDIEGKSLSEIAPGMVENFSDTDLEVIKTQKPRLGILENLKTPIGKRVWVQTDIVPLFDDYRQAIGILVVSTDITEQKLAKDALFQVNHKLNLLSGITRHDIGNELQVLFGYLDIVRDEKFEPVLKSYLDKIWEAADHVKRQISFTRDYQDIGVKSPIWQDVNQIIQQTSHMLNVSPIRINIEITGVEIYADPLIGKVFFNLIDNAKRYGEKITDIWFYGYEKEGAYFIICEDNGVGIPDEFKKKIFNREYYKHTGFGLNLSREILEITNISISEAGNSGIGAKFEIKIPVGKFRLK